MGGDIGAPILSRFDGCAKLGLRKGDDIERTERRGNTAASSEFDLRCALHELLSRAHPNFIRAVSNDGCAHLLYSGKRSRPPGQLRKRTEISMTAGDRDHGAGRVNARSRQETFVDRSLQT